MLEEAGQQVQIKTMGVLMYLRRVWVVRQRLPFNRCIVPSLLGMKTGA